MKHKCDGRVRKHKCIECVHCDVNNMKCHPNSEDCEKEYDLLLEDLIKEDECDFFTSGTPYAEIPDCIYEHISGLFSFLLMCPHCGCSQDSLCNLKPVYRKGEKSFYQCYSCKKLYAL